MRTLIVLLLTLSCTPPPVAPEDGTVKVRDMPITMHFGVGVSLKSEALIYSAADDWERATGGAVRVDFTERDDQLYQYDISVVSDGPLGKCTSMQMILRSDAPDALFRAAAIHELGHKFGLGHLPEGVMMPNISEAENCIDEHALRLACSAYKCVRPKATCR